MNTAFIEEIRKIDIANANSNDVIHTLLPHCVGSDKIQYINQEYMSINMETDSLDIVKSLVVVIILLNADISATYAACPNPAFEKQINDTTCLLSARLHSTIKALQRKYAESSAKFPPGVH
jgi:predicted ThiF/HesA family dinucleotide-utilizing enzyme